MKRLSSDCFTRIEKFLPQRARELEIALLNYYFKQGSAHRVIQELRNYQNFDGGFGHGLEADFALPDSTPMATSVAFQIMDQLPAESLDTQMIQNAITYLEFMYHRSRPGWYAVIKEVNDFPHAPWWNFDSNSHQTVIDAHWGNPNAELIGYFWYYRKYVTRLNPMELVEQAIAKFNELDQYYSEHEIYCYLRLFAHLPEKIRSRIESPLTKAVQALVCLDEKKWTSYNPEPYHFYLCNPITNLGIQPQDLIHNLEYHLDQLEKHLIISPSWEWGAYPDFWLATRKAWEGVLTVRLLRALQLMNMLEPRQ
jgi:hypothetical protein